MLVGGLLILDDSAVGTSMWHLSVEGHLGPSEVATDINPRFFKESLSVGHNRVFQKL